LTKKGLENSLLKEGKGLMKEKGSGRLPRDSVKKRETGAKNRGKGKVLNKPAWIKEGKIPDNEKHKRGGKG